MPEPLAELSYTRTYAVEVEGNRISIGVCAQCGAAVVRGGSTEADVRGHELHQEWHARNWFSMPIETVAK